MAFRRRAIGVGGLSSGPMHSLYVAAYHHADLHGDRENTLSIAQKGKMLRLINHRLGDPKAGLANGTLCAVALLTGCEVRRPYS